MRTLAAEIKLEENEALDYSQLGTLLKGRVTGLKCKYIDLEEYRGEYRLDKFMPSGMNACLLLLTAHIQGRTQRHWTCLIRHKDNTISFFESMAFGLHTLTTLLKDNGRLANFLHKIRATPNKKQLQESSAKIKTCGLHCVCRLVRHDLKSGEYDHWLQGFRIDADSLVTILTYIGHLSVH